MIDTVRFETETGEALDPCAQWGMLLVSHDAPPPPVKTHMIYLDGADGALDLTDWAGGPKYGLRRVSLTLRDMTGASDGALTAFLLGHQVRVYFSERPGWFFRGRCVNAASVTRSRVTDVHLAFDCEPYRLRAALTKRVVTATADKAGAISLAVEGRPALPDIAVSAPCALIVDGEEYDLTPAAPRSGEIYLSKGVHRAVVRGDATLTLTWRDGVL